LALQIESTIQIFWKKVYKSTPQYKKLRFGLANPDLQVRKSEFLMIRDSQILIFKDLFGAIEQRIHDDLWGFVGFMKTGRIFENWLDSWLTIQNKSFFSQDLWSTIQYKSRIHFVRYALNLFGVRICDHDIIQVHGFAKQIHVFLNL